MDKRQTQIQEGAGLTEARLNRDFIEFLKNWSSPALLVLAVIVGGFAGLRWWNERQDRLTDGAWVELEDALTSRNPASLLDVADRHAGDAGIPLIARWNAADILLESAIIGVAPGGVDQNGAIANQDDILTPEKRDAQYTRAAEQYQKVVDLAGNDHQLVMHALRGLFGLAAIDESREKWDSAKKYLERARDLANNSDLPGLADAANKRLASMDELKNPPRIYSAAQIVTAPKPPAPPAGAPGATGASGATGATAPDSAVPQPSMAPTLDLSPALPNMPGNSTPSSAPAPTGPTGATGSTVPTGSPAPTGSAPAPAPATPPPAAPPVTPPKP